MTTFIGDFPVKLDAKGRAALPAAFKKQLSQEAGERFVVKQDIFEDCLALYPMDEWLRQIEIIRSRVNPYNRSHNRFLRGFFRGTAELGLDANSRLLLPRRLLDAVGIDKDVMMAGQDNKIEIWNKERYQQLAEADEDFADLAQEILGNEQLPGSTENE